MKVAINVRFGGFSLSKEAVQALRKTKCPHISREDNPELVMSHGTDLNGIYDHNKNMDQRTCPYLIKVIEDMGKAANGSHAELKVVNVPDGVKCHVEEYDGTEHVAEDHRTWP